MKRIPWVDAGDQPTTAARALCSGPAAKQFFRRPVDAVVWEVVLSGTGISPEAVKRNLELIRGPGALRVADVKLEFFAPRAMGVQGRIMNLEGEQVGQFSRRLQRESDPNRLLVDYEITTWTGKLSSRAFERLLEARFGVIYRIAGASLKVDLDREMEARFCRARVRLSERMRRFFDGNLVWALGTFAWYRYGVSVRLEGKKIIVKGRNRRTVGRIADEIRTAIRGIGSRGIVDENELVASDHDEESGRPVREFVVRDARKRGINRDLRPQDLPKKGQK